ncbi:MAG: lipoate--protein ligase family protein, partial [Chloroflexota bacterium]|nr:lipoate--protein ligase family protein [Chloroflexota bacterium]
MTVPSPEFGRPAWRYIVEDGVEASYGLAADEYLMAGYGRTEPPPFAASLRLYTYRSHCALVGRFQDPAVEVDLERCRRLGVAINRRPTGGGTILMGESQLGIAIAIGNRQPATGSARGSWHSALSNTRVFREFGEGIIRGLAELGIEA